MKSFMLVLFMGMIVSGCSTESKIQGPVHQREVVVKTNKNEFASGDRVSIYQEKCEERVGGGEKHGGASRFCHDTKVGSGEIVKRVSDKEVILRADQNVDLREGLEVKKE